MGKKLNTIEFIKRAKIQHGEQYSYDCSEYIKYKEKLNIRCLEHGIFQQTPSDHLSGYGCMACGGRKPLTTATFIQQAKNIHDNKYNYDNVQYSTAHSDVVITCPHHGNFKQKPYSHLKGHGCLDCSGLNLSNTQTFILKAQKIHGMMYDYSSVDYLDSGTKVQIICPIHGVFIQTPNNHLSGNGCDDCGYIISSNANRSTTEEFIRKAIIEHGDVYDYSLVEYIATHTKVDIICKKHGKFSQKPNTHLSGHGCNRCNNIGGYDYNRLTTDPDLVGVDGYLYLIEMYNENEKFYKIGIARNIKSRLSGITSQYSHRVISTIKLTLLNAFILEQNIIMVHTTYSPSTLFAGHTECLMLSDVERDGVVQMMSLVDNKMTFELLWNDNND